MRLEEALGLQWADINAESGAIHIRRAVTHPTRNQPEIKRPKTESSIRTIGLSPLAVPYLTRGRDNDFRFGGSSPLFVYTGSPYVRPYQNGHELFRKHYPYPVPHLLS